MRLLKSFLKFMVYGPHYHMNKRLLQEAVRRREASASLRDDPELKSIERKMGVTNELILWTWRFITASGVVAIVVICLGL